MGVQWVHCTPRADKFFKRNSQGKFVIAPQLSKCTPGGAIQFLGIFLLCQEDLELE